MHEYEALPGARNWSIRFDARWKTSTFARSATTFHRVQCYTKLVFGPDDSSPTGGRLTEMGYLFCRVREYTIRRTASMVNIPIIMTRTGSAPMTTSNGFAI